ncbi:hypothetical protein [Adhaeribacter radiodurans]|uniref:TonB C-terminal domain-containing protein n=1 Tax=Adhaeribacter radiodurans TaxID=2745197 RepID=A0A7L7L976_9BACT|nr:hypothetical protein [Adhaeribacter radiodurans]QMU29392.1 hypothetical protein HUW48_15705 [Adhaeribacter radiodurans]
MYDKLTKEPVRSASIVHYDSVVTKTNYAGFFQVKSNPGDTILITHNNYGAQSLVTPSKTDFQIGLEILKEKLEFEEGLGNFYKHFGKSIRYPAQPLRANITTKIFVEFKIDSLGRSNLVRVYNDPDKSFSQDLPKIFKSLKGSWSKKYVDKTFILPIIYRIQGRSQNENALPETVQADIILEDIVVTALGSNK